MTVDFLGSFPSVHEAPAGRLPEFAFIGRSNVGKSSLVNMVLAAKELARTSSTPGKTQLLNYFDVDGRWILVDLPGYGYAKVSKKQRRSLRAMIETYLAERETLYCAVLLLDARLPLQAIDHEMITWLAERGIPQAWVFTKVDKGRSRETDAQVDATTATLAADWEQLPPIFRTSSAKGTGRDALLAFITESLPPADQP